MAEKWPKVLRVLGGADGAGPRLNTWSPRGPTSESVTTRKTAPPSSDFEGSPATPTLSILCPDVQAPLLPPSHQPGEAAHQTQDHGQALKGQTGLSFHTTGALCMGRVGV